jgi:hypothetical protein
MLLFIKKSRQGINLNILAFRKPTHVYQSDSCPAGLGGFSNKGFAWRFYLPEHLRFRASNNLLEHIAAVITPWIDILAERLQPLDCALSMTDSTTSEGWLRKSNFREDDDTIQAQARIQVAREHASRYMNLGIRDYSQWFPGKENIVADALSREIFLTDTELISLLRKTVPLQVHSNFSIVPLPNEISSWLISLLQKLPVKEQFREAHTPTTLGHGHDGQTTANPSDSKTIFSSNLLTENKEPTSSELLESHYEKEDSLREKMQLPWLLRQSQVPSVTWHRPSSETG